MIRLPPLRRVRARCHAPVAGGGITFIARLCGPPGLMRLAADMLWVYGAFDAAFPLSPLRGRYQSPSIVCHMPRTGLFSELATMGFAAGAASLSKPPQENGMPSWADIYYALIFDVKPRHYCRHVRLVARAL